MEENRNKGIIEKAFSVFLTFAPGAPIILPLLAIISPLIILIGPINGGIYLHDKKLYIKERNKKFSKAQSYSNKELEIILKKYSEKLNKELNEIIFSSNYNIHYFLNKAEKDSIESSLERVKNRINSFNDNVINKSKENSFLKEAYKKFRNQRLLNEEKSKTKTQNKTEAPDKTESSIISLFIENTIAKPLIHDYITSVKRINRHVKNFDEISNYIDSLKKNPSLLSYNVGNGNITPFKIIKELIILFEMQIDVMFKEFVFRFTLKEVDYLYREEMNIKDRVDFIEEIIDSFPSEESVISLSQYYSNKNLGISPEDFIENEEKPENKNIISENIPINNKFQEIFNKKDFRYYINHNIEYRRLKFVQFNSLAIILEISQKINSFKGFESEEETKNIKKEITSLFVSLSVMAREEPVLFSKIRKELRKKIIRRKRGFLKMFDFETEGYEFISEYIMEYILKWRERITTIKDIMKLRKNIEFSFFHNLSSQNEKIPVEIVEMIIDNSLV